MSTNVTYFKVPEGFTVTKEIACGNTEKAKQKINEMKQFFGQHPHWSQYLKLFRRDGWIFICSKIDENKPDFLKKEG
jgi:hypothetical protein